MKLPSEQEVLECFSIYKVPLHIKQHCLKVRDVAVFLARKLKDAGVSLDIVLVDRMALFHDMFKFAAIKDHNLVPNRFHANKFSAEELAMREKLRQHYPGMHESEIACEVLKREYPAFAERLKREGSFTLDFDAWEERIVRYADMIVLGTAIVPLQERVNYLREMYAMRSSEYWDEFERKIQKEEEKIFTHLLFSPSELGRVMADGGSGSEVLKMNHGNN